MLFSPQIPLQLEPRRDSRFEDYVAGPNEAVVQALKGVLAEPGASLFLQGPESSGKTHLLHALCHAARDAGSMAFYLGLKVLPPNAQAALEGLEGMDLVCVDDLHLVAGNPEWETSLFYAFNRIRAAGGRLVVSSRIRLSALPLGLPDLGSRLAWGLRLQLQALEEAGKREVITRNAAALGIELPEEVASYLLSRGDRSLSGLLAVVERLQRAAFTEKRRVTIPLAREILKNSF